MSQNDFEIANQKASLARADINSALQALASLSSGSTAPATTYANMLWLDTSDNILKIRNQGNDAWLNFLYIDSEVSVLDNTKVVNTGGVQRGILGRQGVPTWESGVGTTESLVSPAKVKAAVAANSPLSESFTTSGQTITSGGLLTLAHGMASEPKLVQAFLVCTTDDQGYSVGDKIFVELVNNSTSGDSKFNGVYYDSSNINIRFSANSQVFTTADKSDGSRKNLTNSRWEFGLNAYA